MITTTQSTARSVALVAIAFLASTSVAETAHAQLFGARSLGKPLTRRSPAAGAGASAMEAAGTVQGNERFLRGNRSRNEFVGSDRDSQQGFVGSGQAIGVGRVRTSVDSLREPPDRSAQINRPLAPLAARTMYYPRLSISASDMATPSYASSVVIKRDEKLESRLSEAAGSNIQVSHQGGRTVIRGFVESESMVEKLRILASFEPHIDNIESQLVVAQQVPAQPINRDHQN